MSTFTDKWTWSSLFFLLLLATGGRVEAQDRWLTTSAERHPGNRSLELELANARSDWQEAKRVYEAALGDQAAAVTGRHHAEPFPGDAEPATEPDDDTNNGSWDWLGWSERKQRVRHDQVVQAYLKVRTIERKIIERELSTERQVLTVAVLNKRQAVASAEAANDLPKVEALQAEIEKLQRRYGLLLDQHEQNFQRSGMDRTLASLDYLHVDSDDERMDGWTLAFHGAIGGLQAWFLGRKVTPALWRRWRDWQQVRKVVKSAERLEKSLGKLTPGKKRLVREVALFNATNLEELIPRREGLRAFGKAWDGVLDELAHFDSGGPNEFRRLANEKLNQALSERFGAQGLAEHDELLKRVRQALRYDEAVDSAVELVHDDLGARPALIEKLRRQQQVIFAEASLEMAGDLNPLRQGPSKRFFAMVDEFYQGLMAKLDKDIAKAGDLYIKESLMIERAKAYARRARVLRYSEAARFGRVRGVMLWVGISGDLLLILGGGSAFIGDVSALFSDPQGERWGPIDSIPLISDLGEIYLEYNPDDAGIFKYWNPAEGLYNAATLVSLLHLGHQTNQLEIIDQRIERTLDALPDDERAGLTEIPAPLDPNLAFMN